MNPFVVFLILACTRLVSVNTAANLTITPERQKLVDFSVPGVSNVSEVVATGPAHIGMASAPPPLSA